MSTSVLEHVNVTVSDPDKTAKMLCDLFDWHIRWQGAAKNNGHTIHVGGSQSYIAVYSTLKPNGNTDKSDIKVGSLNHIGVVVDNLNKIEKRVKEAGFTPYNHGDYEPGRRFYFDDHDGIEIEVVSYE
ncbi:MAG: VOC family protein [Devosiaceae bacterium]|nr:VOC family protein [Devosiaceae bacterium]